MATFKTDFSEYAAGAIPSDWTPIWVTTNSTWTIKSDAAALGGKVLEHTSTADARRAMRWDAVPTVSGDFDILLKWKTSDSLSGNIPTRIFAYVSGSATQSTQQGYQLDGLFPSTLRIGRTLNGAYSTLVSNTSIPSMLPDTWYWYRFRKVGSTLEARIWADGEAEPSTWHVSITNTSLTSGGVGIGSYDYNGVRDYDFFSVGTNGDLAPGPTVEAPSTHHDLSGAIAAVATVDGALTGGTIPAPTNEITNLTEVHLDTVIDLKWDNPTDPNFNFSYNNVYRDGVFLSGNIANGHYQNVGLQPSTAYVYRITSVDTLGVETAGVEISVTTSDAITYDKIRPNQIISINNLTPNDVTVIDDDPAAPDGLVMTPIDFLSAPTVRVKFALPTYPISGLQTIRWLVDDTGYYGSGVRVYENGVQILDSGAQYAGSGTQPIVYIFDGNLIQDKTLQNVEVEWYGVLFQSNTVNNLDAIEWANALSGEPPSLDGAIAATASITGALGIVSQPPTSGGGTPVEWINGQNVSIDPNGTITKTAGGNAWNAGARSSTTQQTNGEDFSVQFTVDTLKDVTFGLSEQVDDSTYNSTSIDYNFTLNSNGTYGVYVLAYLETSGNYSIGDTFKVDLTSGVLRFYKNDTLIHTNGFTIYYPLFVDSSIYTQGHSIPNVGINGAVLSGPIQHALSGAIVANAGATAALNKAIPLSGAVSANAGAAAALSKTVPLSGSLSSNAGVSTADLSKTVSISGAIAAGSEVNGSLKIMVGLVSNTSAVITVNGEMNADREMMGNISSISDVQGVIGNVKGLQANIAANAEITPILLEKSFDINGLIGESSAISGSLAKLTPLQGEILGISTGSAALSRTTLLQGTLEALSSVAAAPLAAGRGLNGSISSVSSLTAYFEVEGQVILTGAISIKNSISANLSKTVPFLGDVLAVSYLTMNHVDVVRPIDGEIAAISSTAAELGKLFFINGSIIAAASTTGSMSKLISLDANSIEAVASVFAEFEGETGLIGLIEAVASLDLELNRHRGMDGSIEALADLLSELIVGGSYELSGSISATSFMSVMPGIDRGLFGEIEAVSGLEVRPPINTFLEVDDPDYDGVEAVNDGQRLSHSIDEGPGRHIEFQFEFVVDPLLLESMEFRVKGTPGEPFTLRAWNVGSSRWDTSNAITYDGELESFVTLTIRDFKNYLNAANKLKISMRSIEAFSSGILTLSTDYAELRKHYFQYQ